MTLADQRAHLEGRRAALVALWYEKKISLIEFTSGIEILSVSIHLLNQAIDVINVNRAAMVAAAVQCESEDARSEDDVA